LWALFWTHEKWGGRGPETAIGLAADDARQTRIVAISFPDSAAANGILPCC
jgi:hypothetical protein